MTDEQKQSFETIAKSMIKWLCENCHPHVTVVVTPTTAELLEGAYVVKTDEFILD